MFVKYHLPALGWALFILIICGIPGNDLPDLSFLEWMKPDKMVHLVIFGWLVYLVIRSFIALPASSFLHQYPKSSAVIFCISYGALIEILQEYIFIHRSGDVRDALANAVGVLLGLWYFNRKTKQKITGTEKIK